MKKVSASLLIVIMFLGLIPFTNMQAGISEVSASSRVNIDDCIQFGSYYDEPILWRVIDFDEDGDPLLYSERILTLKAFDSAGDHHENSDRQSWGSNFWRDSNIRQWLNSSEESIDWIQNPPNSINVWSVYNPYHDEAGFLSNNNFSPEERAVIKTSVNETDYHILDGKGSYTTNDKVFFLSENEYSEYKNQGLIEAKKPTTIAVENSTYKHQNLSSNNDRSYLLRSPGCYSNNIRYVFPDGYVYNDSAFNGIHGVAPALVLNMEYVTIISGEGTENSPYIVSIDSDIKSLLDPLLLVIIVLVIIIIIFLVMILKNKKSKKKLEKSNTSVDVNNVNKTLT